MLDNEIALDLIEGGDAVVDGEARVLGVLSYGVLLDDDFDTFIKKGLPVLRLSTLYSMPFRDLRKGFFVSQS